MDPSRLGKPPKIPNFFNLQIPNITNLHCVEKKIVLSKILAVKL